MPDYLNANVMDRLKQLYLKSTAIPQTEMERSYVIEVIYSRKIRYLTLKNLENLPFKYTPRVALAHQGRAQRSDGRMFPEPADPWGYGGS